MDNYVYLIAGFPDLILDFTNQKISAEQFMSDIRANCAKRDERLLDWLEFGFREENLNNHFYRAVKGSRSHFLKEYFTFDHNLRIMQVAYLVKKYGIENRDNSASIDDTDFEESSSIASALEKENILEREQLLDKIRWDKISEITVFDYFNIEIVLAFLAKVKIVQRWCALDKTKGSELFKQLVSEVRGSFKGVEFE